MCDPSILTAGHVADAGLGVMGAIAQNNAQRKAVQEHNKQVLINAQRAGIAASNQYADIGRQFVYEARSAQQEAQQAVQQGQEAGGAALASAGTSGFSGSSLTVGSVMGAISRRIAENEENYALKLDDMKDSFRSKGRVIEAQAQDRINSMSMQSGPDGMSLGLNIANAVAGAAYKGVKNYNAIYYSG